MEEQDCRCVLEDQSKCAAWRAGNKKKIWHQASPFREDHAFSRRLRGSFAEICAEKRAKRAIYGHLQRLRAVGPLGYACYAQAAGLSAAAASRLAETSAAPANAGLLEKHGLATHSLGACAC